MTNQQTAFAVNLDISFDVRLNYYFKFKKKKKK